MSENSHQTLVQTQFDRQASAYLNSTVHAKGNDLLLLKQQIDGNPQAQILDLGCGGGHVSFALAPLVKHVSAYDISKPMLAVVAQQASQRGLTNIDVCQGDVASLPFAENRFDFVVSRYSAHHWVSWETALSEMRRVLKPTGKLIIIDVISCDNPLLDSFLQTIEMIRDPSHVRNFSLSQWLEGLSRQGFQLEACQQFGLFLEFQAWIERMQPPDEHVATIHSLMGLAGEQVRSYFGIDADGNFTLQSAFIVAH
ncbi:class I SAM-dependent methyltransferase [Celerinatantimonas diazotrophica]|uniref:Methyltransferase family protein n=1 Tax=Celerinatantimonas diazotrophica TaxID=412034 RepID=A0A4R1K1G4_9GAMM|nr:class I SAM-dependent methyltransferase [Celerinatantimonas diazotrophica]TCK57836.1 methyltransferase family protein [Celerinatantimonas diazotrophica]CAG9298100.1 putative methyltransferase YcgJ [Celerinatantimonas diazotrophica]